MYKFLLLATVGTVCCYGGNAVAKTTFLPDWQMADLEFQRDEPLCQDAVDKFGNKLYHKASGCPAPKVFDEHCAHDDRYISECYCPAHYQYNCVSPYRGDERVKKNGYASCDGLYIACCDGSCPGNTSKSNPGGCGGSTTNDCGDTCYYPYQPCCYPSPDETGCTCGSYSCSDGCGGTRTCCSSCPTPPPASSSSSSSSSGSSSSGSGSSGSSSSNSSGSSSGGGSSGSSGGSTCVAGGSASCSGKSSCASDEEQTGSCKNCSGTTLYSCKKKGATCVAGGSASCSGSTSCSYGYSSSCKDCSGTTRYTCKSKPVDPCAGVSCPSAVSCSNGCESYSSATSCCKSVCTSCKRKTCTDTCAQWRNGGCTLSPYGYGTCNDLGTGEGCTDYGCNSLWYCCQPGGMH